MIHVNELRNKLHPRYHHSTLLRLLVESSQHLTTNDLYPNLIVHLGCESSEYSRGGDFAKIDSKVIQNLVIYAPFAYDSMKSLKKRALEVGQLDQLISDGSYSNCRYTSLTPHSLHFTEPGDSTAYR